MDTKELNGDLAREIIENLKNGKIIKLEKCYSNQNEVYEVVTEQRDYIIKIYSKDAIASEKDRIYREEQFKYAEVLKNNGVNAIVPIKIKNRFINQYKDIYYCLYLKVNDDKKINYDNLIKLFIDAHVKVVSLKINKHYKKTNLKLDILNDLFEQSNYYTDKVKKLYVFQNDFKPLNILWEKGIPYLIDFDATGYSNINANLIEFAINFCYKDHKLNYKLMNRLFRTYEKISKTKLDNFEEAFYLSLNGKISWLEYTYDGNEDGLKNNLLYYINSNKDKIRAVYLNEK